MIGIRSCHSDCSINIEPQTLSLQFVTDTNVWVLGENIKGLRHGQKQH